MLATFADMNVKNKNILRIVQSLDSLANPHIYSQQFPRTSRASQNNQNDQAQSVDQNQRPPGELGAESTLESFASGSSSNTYTPSAIASTREVLETAIRDGQSASHTSQMGQHLIDSLVSLLREQIDENRNLRVTLSDLEATVADLRDQLYERENSE